MLIIGIDIIAVGWTGRRMQLTPAGVGGWLSIWPEITPKPTIMSTHTPCPSVLRISMTAEVIPRSYAPLGLRVVCDVPVSTTKGMILGSQNGEMIFAAIQ